MSEPDIWADMLAELGSVKALPFLERIKVGDRVALKQGWIINRAAMGKPINGTVTAIRIGIHPAPPAECRTGEEQGEFYIDNEWWTNRHYIERILD